jgi:NAD(P)-dependent dehydrogenase (short-subunit alcohol dehydrogenase family)
MDSVRDFSSWFRGKYSHLNILVNNAGIHYMTSAMSENARMSKQGYDLSFATNYMGHFLLTEELLPMMTQEHSLIINVASSYHFAVNDRMLTTGANSTPPLFSQVGNSYMHAYPTSKLAQVLHTKELQRRLASAG